MPTPEDTIAQEMRNELEARLAAWKREREQLLIATARIAELDGLIAAAEVEAPVIKIAPRPKKIVQPAIPASPANGVKSAITAK